MWSRESVDVVVNEISLNYRDGNYAEMHAVVTNWNVDKQGLIYTDPQWINDFRVGLRALGFTEEMVHAVDYSEHGMQGTTFVSLDVGAAFLVEHPANAALLQEWDARRLHGN